MFGLLRKYLRRKLEPTWEELYDPEWSEARAALMAKVATGHIYLRIIKHGPDQYSAFYESTTDGERPLHLGPEWWERSQAAAQTSG